MTLLRRWGVWAAVVVVAVVALAVGASRPAPAGLDARVRALAEQVRCPVCQGESAEQSQVPAAVTIRQQIHAELAAGIPPSSVLHDLERAYGVTILEKPPASGVGLAVWLVPIGAAALALAGLALAFARWRRRPGAQPATSAPSAPPTPGGDDALVAEALAAGRDR